MKEEQVENGTKGSHTIAKERTKLKPNQKRKQMMEINENGSSLVHLQEKSLRISK